MGLMNPSESQTQAVQLADAGPAGGLRDVCSGLVNQVRQAVPASFDALHSIISTL